MAPNQYKGKDINETRNEANSKYIGLKAEPREYKIVWRNVVYYLYTHIISLYGIYLVFTSAKLYTTIFAFILMVLAMLGSTCGAHRLWSHKSYKAKTPLKIILVTLQTLAMQDSVITWARDHRAHHKFSETDADPYTTSRGLFFSHIGCLLVRRHPDVKLKGSTLDISDLTNDPILQFQHKYYKHLTLIALAVPALVPAFFWDESLVSAWTLNFLRLCVGINFTFTLNSLAHKYGNKPYDRFMNASDNVLVSVLTLGDGWHNYHHAFPWDYRSAEFGKYSTNVSTSFIDFFVKVGWAYDLKTVSEDVIRKRALRTGNGTRNIWGWTDKDMLSEEIQDAVVKRK